MSFLGDGSCCQSSSTKGFIRKAGITLITVLQSRWKTIHDCFEGNGKVELKSVSSSSSDLRCHAGLMPNDCEEMSAIAMLGVNGQAFCCFARRAIAWTRCSTTVERFEASFVAHPIVGELLLNRVRRFSSRGPQTSSMASHRRTRPAISKSKFVMRPSGLVAVLMSLVTSGGHFHRKIVGTQGDSSPITTPPAPWPEASTKPM